MDYQKFKLAFEASGLSQRAYGEKISMSPSMVSYYVRKANRSNEETSGFKAVKVVNKPSISKEIKITTSSGMEIIIPI